MNEYFARIWQEGEPLPGDAPEPPASPEIAPARLTDGACHLLCLVLIGFVYWVISRPVVGDPVHLVIGAGLLWTLIWVGEIALITWRDRSLLELV